VATLSLGCVSKALRSARLGGVIPSAVRRLRAVANSLEARGAQHLFSAVRLMRAVANSLEARGAQHLFKAAPVEIESSYDFVAEFHYGSIRPAPVQIRGEMLGLLERLADRAPRTILEIGTYRGGTLFLFTRVAAPDATLVTVDMNAGDFGGPYPRTWAPFLKSFAREKQKVQLVRGDSHSMSTLARIKSLLNEPIDFLFIDGDHRYEGVRADFEMYAPLVRVGGLIGLHDIVEGTPELVGGVPTFWREIGTSFATEEIVADPSQGGYGIGLLRK
jgi:predicted O-methyltransferase YrrM